jgi:hypothetical protein
MSSVSIWLGFPVNPNSYALPFLNAIERFYDAHEAV